MSQTFTNGDFLVFQLESGFALLRLLDVEDLNGEKTWHVAAYSDLFPDVDSAEAASAFPQNLSPSNTHIALTNRAFESTQVAKISNVPLTDEEKAGLAEWNTDPDRNVSDRSVRLMLGLR
ncbi:MAG: hypothetical protein ABIP78_01545 [Pyrinomonadaceae bacterium]